MNASSRLRSWQAWACLLVAIYLVIGAIGWNRTLIPDEIRPLLMAARPFSEQLAFIRLDLVQTPLSYLLGRFWLDVFGHTDSSAKALALLLNVPTLILFTYLATLVTPSWRLLTVLFSSTYFRIGSSVNLVRMYGLLLLLTVLAMLLWQRWRKDGSIGWAIAWVVVMTLAIYTHASALLLLFAFLIVNWTHGRRPWVFTMAAIIPGLALLPWVAYVFPVYQSRGIAANVTGGIDRNATLALAKIPFYFLSGEDAGGGSPVPPLHTPGLREVLAVCAVLLHIALLFVAWRKIRELWNRRAALDENQRWFWICAKFVGIPLLALYGFSVIFTPVVNARYLLLGLPAYWLVILNLGKLGGQRGAFIVSSLFLPWILLSDALAIAQNAKPSPTFQATSQAMQQIHSSDFILCDRHMPYGWQVYWEWTRRLGRPPGPIEILASPMAPWLEDIPYRGKTLESLDLSHANRVWFFYRYSEPARVSEFLGSHGFVPDKQFSTDSAFLMVFAKAGLQP